ncbi:MerR family transcriptional regulator [Caryophanon latum]|uniref:HTH merR-type domain-containing protein n=1 Tax=Caryophanon latum TaxID=33977 RepID=A0A1C0Z0K7_9BACL|nr:MerR family transcriptional regulator [Caryophanon latum]OCS92896.1 hypothetical protein A6K76_05750 [Caryophanon latum]
MLSITALASMSGVSTRTLRHYDAIGLLQPAAYSDAGYRMYEESQTLVLQQIMLYKQMGLSLPAIQELLYNPSFDVQEALAQHLKQLQQQQQILAQQMETLQRTLRYVKGEITMTTNEQFEGFKQQKVAENEALYGEEIRGKYGEQSVMSAYGQFKQMTPEQYEGATQLENQLFALLADMLVHEEEETMLEIAELHKRWLSMYWPKYTKQAHRGLSEMYIADERFTQYYDKRAGEGATQLLYKAIQQYTNT